MRTLIATAAPCRHGARQKVSQTAREALERAPRPGHVGVLRHAFAAVLAGAVMTAASASAQEHRLWVGLDVDRDSSTGCSLNGGDENGEQTVSGFEWSAEISVDPNEALPNVTAVQGSSCDAGDTVSDPTWGPPSEDSSPGWSVGVDPDGLIGDVVELLIETSALGLSGPVRLVVLSESAGGHRDTLVTKDGSSSGPDILFPSGAVVPSLTRPSLVALALGICLLAGLLIRRPVPGSPVWIALLALGSARAVWALTLSLDGQIQDWEGVSVLASDPSEDSETDDPSADLLSLFAAWDTADIAIRIDVSDLGLDLCDHSDTPCRYVETNGSDTSETGSTSAPWATLAYAVSQLEDDDRVVVRSGTYQETERIEIDANGVHIVAEDGVVLHNTIEDFVETNQSAWVVHDSVSNVYRSANTYSATLESHVRGYFLTDENDPESAVMLIAYDCYEALAADHSYYPPDPDNIKIFQCADLPNIGPGVYWDVDGNVSEDADENPLDPGHIYVRMTTTSEQFEAVADANEWDIDSDPNATPMKITVEGPFLQLNGSDVRVSNLTLELGSIRMGGGSSGNELRAITLDGPAPESPIEFYSGGSHHLLDGLIIDQKFPDYAVWQDTKELFKSSLMYAAITLNDHDDDKGYPDPIHHITLRNSLIENTHDGLELNQDAYHHVYIHGNEFINTQDDGIQLGSSTYDVEIAGNTFINAGTSVSRHGTGGNDYPGRKYIHHNFIDVSTPKYYCREIEAGGKCSGDGSQTMRAFGLHDGDGWEEDGDPRYIYNNTVVMDGDILGVGLHGQNYQDPPTLPYGQPSLIFNNVFVQLDQSTQFTIQSPKWAILAPATLILDGNYYYRPSGGSSSEGPFEMSGKRCDFDLYRDEVCILVSTTHPEGWEPQLSPEWEYTDYDAAYSWGIEDQGLFDDSNLDLDTYVPSCDWLDLQLDPDTHAPIEAVDLTTINGAYTVSTVDPVTEEEIDVVWSLNVVPPLPGVDGSYRGDTPCSDPEEE